MIYCMIIISVNYYTYKGDISIPIKDKLVIIFTNTLQISNKYITHSIPGSDTYNISSKTFHEISQNQGFSSDQQEPLLILMLKDLPS